MIGGKAASTESHGACPLRDELVDIFDHLASWGFLGPLLIAREGSHI